MQNLTETRYRELIPGFSKPVINVKTLSVSADEDERIFMVMSGLLKPARRLTKRLLETRFTVHKQLTEKNRQCSYSNVSELEQKLWNGFQ